MCKLNKYPNRETLLVKESLKNGGVIIVDAKSEPGSFNKILELKRKCHLEMRKKIRIVKKYKK